MHCRSVLLPPPEGPIRTLSCPRWMDRDTPLMISFRPEGLPDVFDSQNGIPDMASSTQFSMMTYPGILTLDSSTRRVRVPMW